MAKEINYTAEGHAIPFEDVAKAAQSMAYGSTLRVMFLMLHYTGCRISELETMEVTLICNKTIHWRVGKNQTGFRKVELPEEYLIELQHFRNTHKVPQSFLFPIKASTFRRRFNKDIRPYLGREWNRLRIIQRHSTLDTEYEYQLKGLRKNFVTFLFNKNYSNWKDAGISIDFTCKAMKHSNTGITAIHYVENNKKLNIKKYLHLEYNDILKNAYPQNILMSFVEEECQRMGKS